MDRFRWLDFDPCYTALRQASNDYKRFVEQGISPAEQLFLSEMIARSQIAGSGRFTEEVENRTGVRIQNRKPGRPRK